jgi:hypothetical protein
VALLILPAALFFQHRTEIPSISLDKNTIYRYTFIDNDISLFVAKLKVTLNTLDNIFFLYYN